MFSSALKDVAAFFRGGTSGFNRAEKQILDAVANRLSSKDASVFTQQIASVSLVQRHNPGRLIAAYYPKRKMIPELPYPGYEYCLAKVSYEIMGRTKTTNVVLHDGHLMTLERSVPLKSEIIDRITSVELHPDGYASVAVEIDAEEHGNA